MFEWVSSIGANTWALFILIMIVAVSGLISTRGITGYIVGGLIAASAAGGMAQIIAYRGSEVPVLNMPWGITLTMLMVLLLGLNLVAHRSSLGAGGDRARLREQLPKFDSQAVVLLAIAVVLVLVPGLFLWNSLDLHMNESDRGTTIAQNQVNSVNRDMWRSFERFLAK